MNFIGLVDDGDSRDTYGEEYENGNYGRQAAYTPARSSAQQSRASSSRSSRQSSRRSLPEPRSSRFDDRSNDGYDDQEAAGYDDYNESRYRPASRFDDREEDRYAPSPSRQTGRSSSRFAEPQERRQPAPAQSQAPARQARTRAPQRSRTVMYSLHTLEDCCDVIDQLIANNTVVLTMDELDGRLLQRAVDTLSGAVFALHASIRKASDKTYLVAPMSVEVNDAYDVERGFR